LIIGDKIAPLPFPPETDKVNGLSILNSWGSIWTLSIEPWTTGCNLAFPLDNSNTGRLITS
jgi:hypothetical protein